MKKLLTPNFIIVSLAFFFYALGNTLFDLMPLHLETIEVGKKHIGTMMSFSGLGGFVILPLMAVIIDRVNLKTLTGIAMGILIISQSTYLINASPYPLYALPLFIRGAMLSLFMISFMTLISHIVPDGKRMMGFSIFGIMGQLPFPLSIGIGEQIYHSFGFKAITLIAFACFALSFIILRFFKYSKTPAQKQPESSPGSMGGIFKSAGIYPFLISFCLLTYAFGTLQVFLPGLLFSRGIFRISLFWIIFPITIIILRLMSAPILDKFTRKTLIVPALAVLPPVFISLLQISSYSQLILPALLYGLAHGILFPVLNAALIDHAPEGFRGRIMVISQLMISLGLFISANAGGRIAGRWSIEDVFITATVVTSCGILMFAVLGIKNRIS